MIDILANSLRDARGLAHKADIAPVLRALAPGAGTVRLGDDCAAIPDGDGFLLFATEGFLPAFVAHDPWFAGWSGVMVNLSDVAAMGGRPVAVVDAIWSDGEAAAGPLLAGLASAAQAYGVPIVGGHTNVRAPALGLSVSVLGRARHLLTSFDARPGDVLVAAIDLRGRVREPDPFWDAATGAPPARLRGDFEILPAIAEAKLCKAAKDISMAGLVGTAAMLLDCSDAGATIDLAAIPRPAGVPLERWLLMFPSFGFILAAPPTQVDRVIGSFAARDIAAAAVGTCDATRELRIRDGKEIATIWRFMDRTLLGVMAAA